MPNFDGTGPLGQGPWTGRGRNRYRIAERTKRENTIEQSPESKEILYGIGRGGRPWGRGEFGNLELGRGYGRRFGKGRGFGNR